MLASVLCFHQEIKLKIYFFLQQTKYFLIQVSLDELDQKQQCALNSSQVCVCGVEVFI